MIESLLRCDVIMRWILLLSLTLLSFSSQAQDSPLNGRVNVMECSHDEVMAYMELPNPERRAMRDYFAWQTAYKQTEATKAENDPTVCLGMLYGDLSVYAARMKEATQKLFSLSPPDMASIVRDKLSSMFDKLTESICKRAKATVSEADQAVSKEINLLKRSAEQELKRRYGQRAMDGYLSDALPPEFQEQGLRFRNGTIDQYRFQRSMKNQWGGVLDEMGGIN